MSFFGIHILTDAAVAHLKAAGHDIVAAAIPPAHSAVAALMNTDVGKAVKADIEVVESQDLTGVQKFERVLGNTLPLIVSFLAGGGVAKTVQEVESIGRELVQSVFNAEKSTTAGSVAVDILHLLGVS